MVSHSYVHCRLTRSNNSDMNKTRSTCFRLAGETVVFDMLVTWESSEDGMERWRRQVPTNRATTKSSLDRTAES